MQIKGEQSIKDNTTNYYKKGDIMNILQRIKVLLLHFVNTVHVSM